MKYLKNTAKCKGRGDTRRKNIKKVEYVTRPHASIVVVTTHIPKPGRQQNNGVFRSNGFACINVTLHVKVFSVEVQLFYLSDVYVAGI